MGRTTATDAEIRKLDAAMHAIEVKLDALTKPEEEASEEEGALDLRLLRLKRQRDRLCVRRAEEELLDHADQLKAKEGKILECAEAAWEALQRRTGLGAELDALIPQLGALLNQVQAANKEANDHIGAAMRMVPQPPGDGDDRWQRVRDLRITINAQLNGSFAGPALASKLRANGVGKVGVPMELAWGYGTMDSDASVELALAQAHVSVSNQFTMFLSTCLESVPRPEPTPSRLTEHQRKQQRHWSEMTAEEHEAAAIAALGRQTQPQHPIDDLKDATEEERAILRGAYDATGQAALQTTAGNVRVRRVNPDTRVPGPPVSYTRAT